MSIAQSMLLEHSGSLAALDFLLRAIGSGAGDSGLALSSLRKKVTELCADGVSRRGLKNVSNFALIREVFVGICLTVGGESFESYSSAQRIVHGGNEI